jgi:prepilin-type N-terminal cleavage/methylation domain-containing protein
MTELMIDGFKRQATLVELLTVVAVIGILAGMAYSGFARARAASEGMTCKSNARQIGMQLFSYAEDWQGMGLPASVGETVNGGDNHWINIVLNHTAGVEGLFACPSLPEKDRFDPAGHVPGMGNKWKRASYIMNTLREGDWAGADSSLQGAGAHGFGLDSTHSIPLNSVQSPSQKIYVTDVVGKMANTHKSMLMWKHTDHGERRNPPTGDVRRVGDHHRGGFKALFGDGHVSDKKDTLAKEWNVSQP